MLGVRCLTHFALLQYYGTVTFSIATPIQYTVHASRLPLAQTNEIVK